MQKSKDGRQHWCKECNRENMRGYRKIRKDPPRPEQQVEAA